VVSPRASLSDPPGMPSESTRNMKVTAQHTHTCTLTHMPQTWFGTTLESQLVCSPKLFIKGVKKGCLHMREENQV
jgi:hypothetical protein